MQLGDYLMSGFTLHLDDVDAITAHYVKYYVTMSKAKLEETRFEVLGKMLSKIFGGK